MSPAQKYHKTFFSHVAAGSSASAQKVVPLLLGVAEIRSVVDVGCGTGAWLAQFAASGIEDYLGLDGDYVDQGSLAIPKDRFRPTDLEQALDLGRRFDLATSFEVAEHLPAEIAPKFVRSLTGLAPLVAFSAAIPGQGGVGHVNEQWPDYWAGLFAAEGYDLVDWFRCRLWNDDSIEPWYRQNLVLFVERDRVAGLKSDESGNDRMPLRVVHPDIFSDAINKPSLRTVLKSFPAALRLSLESRWARRPGWLANR